MQADQKEITRLLKTARGQIDGLLRMVEEDRYCMDVSNQLLATRALLATINKRILLAHLDGCVRHAFLSDDHADAEQKLEEIKSLLNKMS